MRYVGFGVGHIHPSVRADPAWPTVDEDRDSFDFVEGEDPDDGPIPGSDAQEVASETEHEPIDDIAGDSDRESVSLADL